MIVLSATDAARAQEPVLALFGAGLIGSALVSTASDSRLLRPRFWPFDWENLTAQRQQLSDIEKHLTRKWPLRTLIFLWSAGRAGFSAGPSEVERELASFRGVLDFSMRVGQRLPDSRIVFGFVSSAGGLFEGQTSVGPSAIPQPRRPYGLLKLRQERLLAHCSERLVVRVYRPSSVYGYPSARHRRGLITTLVANGVRRQVTRITAKMETLRDFVWVDDVARYIVHDSLAAAVDQAGTAYMTLAAGKPTSFQEISAVVERTLGHKLYVSFAGAGANSEDITFSPAAVPADWSTSHLECNVRRIYQNVLTEGAAFERGVS